MSKFEKITQDYIKEHIQEFTNKKTVIITGAGVSVSSGIPDFRSKNGIFNSIKEKLKIKGQDLFNYRYSRDKETRPNYYKFIANLKNLTENAQPSKTHYFLQEYKKVQKKTRIYTQNIDLLEEKAGIKHSEKENSELVYLHGNLKHLVCIYCGYKIEYTAKENAMYEKGDDIECKKCIEENVKRKNSKRREVGVGYMHTNIIHYEQPHHDAYKIGKMFEKDMDVDLFIVIGTSLKIYGVKDLVKRGLRHCMINNGKSIFVNLEEPSKEYKNMFDYFWNGDCDKFCEAMETGIEMMKIDDKLERLRLKKDRTQSKTKSKEHKQTCSIAKIESVSKEVESVSNEKMLRYSKEKVVRYSKEVVRYVKDNSECTKGSSKITQDCSKYTVENTKYISDSLLSTTSIKNIKVNDSCTTTNMKCTAINDKKCIKDTVKNKNNEGNNKENSKQSSITKETLTQIAICKDNISETITVNNKQKYEVIHESINKHDEIQKSSKTVYVKDTQESVQNDNKDTESSYKESVKDTTCKVTKKSESVNETVLVPKRKSKKNKNKKA